MGAPVPAGSFEMSCPGPQAVSHGVPPFNDRPAPPVSSPDSPKQVHPLPPSFWASAAAARSGGTA